MKISEEKHEAIEKTETPEFEAKEHSKGFLKKAAKLAVSHKSSKAEHKKMPKAGKRSTGKAISK